MELLDPAEQRLIELKYMSKRNDGSRYCDEVIYPQLFIGRTRYHELKKEALEMLGKIYKAYLLIEVVRNGFRR